MEHIQYMHHDSLLVKSADVLHNLTDQLNDYQTEGDAMFKRFTTAKDMQLQRYIRLIDALQSVWPDNPLVPELTKAVQEATRVWS